MPNRLTQIIDDLYDSYDRIGGINHLGGPALPSRLGIINILNDFESLIFPGYREEEAMDARHLRFSIGEKLSRLARNLTVEVQKSLCYKASIGPDGECRHDAPEQVYRDCHEEAEALSMQVLHLLPELRGRIKMDVEAAFAGDPASRSREEVVLSYPGVEAIIAHRIAHELWIRHIPLIPRMISEHIHGKTGVDIHPGADIGDYFFIDHATGVVIGETTVIGRNVKIYQGVTLGALSVKKSEANVKRHPTIEDDVTIYSRSTIFGGKTTVVRGSVIGGNVWIVSSVPAGSKIYNRPGEYIMKSEESERLEFHI